jgi:zinc protease
VFVDKPDRTQSQLYIGRLGTHARDADHTAVSVATTAFGGTFTAPLMREVRSERGWSYGASARLGVDLHRELFSVWTAPAAKDAANCLALELELLETWFEKGTARADLEFTKKFLLRSRVFDIDTASKRVQLHLEQALLDLPRNYHATYADRVTSVTKSQADKSVRERLDLDDLVIAIVGTYREIGQAIERAIPRLDASRVVAFDRE